MTRACCSVRLVSTTWTAVFLASVLTTACSGGGSRPRTQPVRPPSPAPPSSGSLRPLYEAGRYQEVVAAASSTLPNQGSPEHVWLTAHSYLKLNRKDDARLELARLSALDDKAWQLVGRIATALLDGNATAIDRATAAASAYPNHPFVQYELGLALAGRSNFAESARAMDITVQAAPDFAYAYYYGGLAYQRLGRLDLTAVRLETFIRLAPQAPERPQVESILQTIRGK